MIDRVVVFFTRMGSGVGKLAEVLKVVSHRPAFGPSDDETIRGLARKIFAAGCEAANPTIAVQRAMALDSSGCTLSIGRDVDTHRHIEVSGMIDLEAFDRIIVIGIGKACVRMAEGVQKIMGSKVESGFLITKYGHSDGHKLCGKFRIREASHPTPDENCVNATRELVELLSGTDEKTLVIALITGGGSSLLCAPQEPLCLSEFQQVSEALLACGCPIEEKNCMLKHLSTVKGGFLARLCAKATMLTLLISDVVGDPLDAIASGPTLPDSGISTYAYCTQIVDRYGLRDRLPEVALQILSEGLEGKRPETPKHGDPAFRRNLVHVVSSNEVAVDTAIQKATELGFNTLALSSFMEGEATELAKAYVGLAKEISRNGRPVRRPAVLVGGGETTVTLPTHGHGLGGRSQALALSALRGIEGLEGVAILAGGTDGGDGPCDAAGAVVCGGDAAAAASCGLEAEEYMQRADSYHFFENFEKTQYGKTNIVHLKDGPTGTNVMDLVIVLVMDREDPECVSPRSPVRVVPRVARRSPREVDMGEISRPAPALQQPPARR
eukprot:TRINITY_DN6831_c0_g2_i1.p1 TRINITY_DN6831_c0_g2~~TRINITY_DN6831_c0_g2_i1.p1  ORF type:complete len:553 (+),score=100.59 TRINITY_DN6831_c0_g2_i1:18-1676(+)